MRCSMNVAKRHGTTFESMWCSMNVSRPAHKNPFHHPQPDRHSSSRINVAAFAYTDSGVKRDWTLNHDSADTQRRVHEMRIEFEIDPRIQEWKQTFEGFAAH